MRTQVLPTKTPDNTHSQFRHIRMLRNGHLLVAHMDLGKAIEYDAAGNRYGPSTSVWAAVRLKNGNTLLSGNQRGYVREVNRKGEIVWEVELAPTG